VNIFKRDKKRYSLIKLYVVFEDDWKNAIVDTFNEFQKIFDVSLLSYAVNYGAEQKLSIEKLNDDLLKVKLEDLELLELQNADWSQGLTVSHQFGFLSLPERVYEFMFVFEDTSILDEVFCTFVNTVSVKQQILYGYGRNLMANISPVSENVIKRTLLGSFKTNSEGPIEQWMDNPLDIFSGSIKGIYSLNLILSQKFKDPKLEDISRLDTVKVSKVNDMFSILKIDLSAFEYINRNIFKNSKFVRI